MRRDRLVEAAGRGHISHADPEMVDDPIAPQRAVMNGLDAVAVRIEQERPVVDRRLRYSGLGPGCPASEIPRLGARPPELIDLVGRGRHEADV